MNRLYAQYWSFCATVNKCFHQPTEGNGLVDKDAKHVQWLTVQRTGTETSYYSAAAAVVDGTVRSSHDSAETAVMTFPANVDISAA